MGVKARRSYFHATHLHEGGGVLRHNFCCCRDWLRVGGDEAGVDAPARDIAALIAARLGA